MAGLILIFSRNLRNLLEKEDIEHAKKYFESIISRREYQNKKDDEVIEFLSDYKNKTNQYS